MWGGIGNLIQLLSATSSTTRQAPQLPEKQNRNTNMKQQTGVHIHINTISGQTRIPRQTTSGSNHKIGQNQGTSKSIGYSGYSPNPQGLQNTNYTPGKKSYKGQFNQDQKPFNNNTNQRYHNSNQNNQNFDGRKSAFNGGRSGYNTQESGYNGGKGGRTGYNGEPCGRNRGESAYNARSSGSDAGRTGNFGGRSGCDEKYQGPKSGRVVIVKKTQVINKKIIINKK